MGVFIVSLIQLLCLSISQNSRLVFLYTHFRHGARAPMAINETFYDLVGEKWNNPGELTGIGQRMHYLLGLRNRIRYMQNYSFLNEKFDAHEILIYSSNLNRTILSASSQLQGFFPQSSEKGETLTDKQESVAYPQVDVDCDEINNEITKLNKSALPYKMTLAPVRMVNDNDKKMNVYDLEECKEERDEIKKNNRETIPYLINFTREYNEKYGQTINNFLGTNKNFTLLDIDDFCDAFLSSYTDQRNLSYFKKTGLNEEEMNDYCYEYFRVSYLYQFHGDDEKLLAHVDSSKLMTELMFHMKRRLDADISSEDEDANVKDYSYPKMLMISGHDSTCSADEIFILNALGLNLTELYIFPKYASQLALEVKSKTGNQRKSSYSDYYVEGYFNDKLLFNVTADQFISKIEADIWSQDKIDEFCGFDDSSSSSSSSSQNGGSSNGTSGNSTLTTSKKSDKAKKAYKALMIVFICLSAILLATTICLAYKLSQRSISRAPLDSNYNPNGTNNSTNPVKNV